MEGKLTTAQIIAATAKALKAVGGGTTVASRQPQVGFQGSKGTIIDLRITDKPQAVKAVKPIKQKKEFKDFFNPDVKIEVIEKIQNDFKDYYGKKMAVLIYLLETDFKFISYSLDSKTDGRKHLVDCLNNSKPNMQPINKCFITYSYKLDITSFEKDKDFVTIKEKLSKAIK
jgi:hypothetical protein